MPKIGKKHFPYTRRGRRRARRYAKKIGKKIEEKAIGPVAQVNIRRTRARTHGDPTSEVSSDLTLRQGVQTHSERQGLRRAETTRRAAGRGLDPKRSNNPSARRSQSALAIAAGTEMDWTNKLVEKLNIKKAIKRPGALRRKDPTPNTPITGKDISKLKKSKNKRTRAQARFAQTLAKLRKK